MAPKTETATRKSVGQNVSATRRVARLRRHARLRKKVSGTAERPRLVVNRSSRHIHVQLVNDLDGNLLTDRHVTHVYTISDGLVQRMDVED